MSSAVTFDTACRLCGQSDRELFLSLPRSPANVSRLLYAQDIDQDAPVDLAVWHCRACGFIQIDPTIAESFYDDYLMTVSHSPLMQRYQREQASDFIARFGLRGRRIVEIGCGDGNYLEELRAAGGVATGSEPSVRFRALAESRGFRVHAGYVRRTAPVPGGPYDAFVTRQVLEHVPDPRDFLLGVRASVGRHGLGLVEVPSLEKALAGYRFYDFFADHVNYFSTSTLRLALELAGFDVVETSRGMNDEFNVAIVKVAEFPSFGDFDGIVQNLLSALRSWAEAQLRCGHRVAVWGAGGKGLALMAMAELQGIAYVVDSDPRKQGLYTPVGHQLVVPPERLFEDPVDALVLTAQAYRDEIVADLRGRLAFRGPIAALGTQLEVLLPER
jgi:SAM-dependent methyltransferase